MSLTAVYNGDLSRVQLSADNLGASATYATVERSLNQQLWLTVRGGVSLPVESQEAQLHDFEFFADVQNHYRIRSFDDDDVLQEEFTTDITPELDGIWLKSIRYPLLNRRVQVVDSRPEISRASRSELQQPAGRSVPVAAHDVRGGRQFTLSLVVDGEQAAGAMDVILAAGTTWLVHVPADAPASVMPGGYVSIGDTTQRRLQRFHSGGSTVFELPCTVVAPPAPQVVGTLLVAETLFRLFGDANALLAAHSTGRSLLATIGDPSDLVVI